MDTYRVRQGTALDFTVDLVDTRQVPITTYAGTEALTATVWPGGSLASSFHPAAAWISGPAGTIAVTHTAAQVGTLAQGRYRGTLDIADPAMGPVEAYAWAFDVLLAPGTGTVGTAYCAYADLLMYARTWLGDLQSTDDDAGFTAQCARARSWLDDLIVAGWMTNDTLSLGDPGYGAVLTGRGSGQLPSAWLREQLDAGALIVRDLVVEVCAKKALAYICEGQVGPTEAGQTFQRLGLWYHREAAGLARTLRAEVDTVGPGIGPPQFAVNLGQGSMRG